MRYQLIVWDFDGTLADTFTLALVTYNDLAAKYGFLPVTDPAAARGLGSRAFLRRHGISLLRLPQLVHAFHTAVRSRMGEVRLFAEVPDLLRALRGAGYRLGILSSNTAENIQACLRVNGADDLFDFVVGYPRLFGKARAIRKLLRREGVESRQFLYVGDEARDVEAAHKAGVDSGAVGWGFHTEALLAGHQPTFLWTQPAQLLADLLEDPRTFS